MKVIVAGSRDITDRQLVWGAIERSGFEITELVSGCCRGVDECGNEWALRNGVAMNLFGADWDKHGAAAGPIRNQAMANYADALVLVWDGKSRGSQDMLMKATVKGLKIYAESTKETSDAKP